jgi:hypothetical protein
VEPIPTVTNMHKRCSCARSLFMKDVGSCIMILKFTFNGKICRSTFFYVQWLVNF